jgi:type I restriction enzyme, S subunit
VRELPKGWMWTISNDVCASVRDGTHDTPKYIENGIPLVTSKNLKFGRIDFSTAKHISLEDHQQITIRSGVEDGDIIFPMIGTVGNPVLVTVEKPFSIKNVGLFKKNPSVIASIYLKHWLSSPLFERILEEEKFVKGTTQKFIPLVSLRNLPIPLPPLNEQKRIADRLDLLLTRIDKTKAHLDRIPPLLKRFRQSVLAAATSGKLTEDWREENSELADASQTRLSLCKAHADAGGHKRGNAASPTEEVHDLTLSVFPNGWKLVELKEVVRPDKPITYGILKPGPELENGIPYIRVADFPKNILSTSGIRKTSPKIDAEFSRSKLEEGDILLSIRGTVGRLVVIPPELSGANITQDSARLSVQSVVNRDYILWFLRSEMAQQRMQRAVKGVAVRGINIGDVRALQIPLPSLEEQHEIVRRVEVLFAKADRIEAQYKTARQQVDRLTPALLAKAFRGELVPQDPNDEPASVLLERVKADRAGSEKKARSGRIKKI